MCDAVVHIPGGTAGVAMSVDAFRCELDRRGALYDLFAQQYAADLIASSTTSEIKYPFSAFLPALVAGSFSLTTA